MSYGYFQSYIPVLLLLGVVTLLAVGMLLLSYLIGTRRPTPRKLSPYESGFPPADELRPRVGVPFYRVALAFALFNVAVIFLYPWAVVFHQLRMYGFLAMMVFLLLVVPGYIYLWKKGVFNWSRAAGNDSEDSKEP